MPKSIQEVIPGCKLKEEIELQRVNFHCSACVDIKISVVDGTEESCNS